MAFQGLMRGLYGHGGVFISQDPIIIGGGGCLHPAGSNPVALSPETTKSQSDDTPDVDIGVSAALG